MNILINGPQGSGKTTQAKLLAQKLNLNQLDTGTMFRESAETEFGKKAKEFTDGGNYVPDEIVFGMVKEYIDKNCDKSKGFVFTGFPRTLAQIPFMEKTLGIKIDKVIDLKVSEAEFMKRLEKRRSLEGRSDETPQAIKKRLEEYTEKTKPVLDYYRAQGIVIEIDGERSIEEIHENILKIV